MSTSALQPAPPATATCPSWCHSHESDPWAVRHFCMTGVVLRDPRVESVAVEVEQPIGPGRVPIIVLSVFTQKKSGAMSAGLTCAEARAAYAALGEAIRIASETVR